MAAWHHLLDVIGVELEYMIVDAETLSVRPVADVLLRNASAAGQTGEESRSGRSGGSGGSGGSGRAGESGGDGDGEPAEAEIYFGPISWSNELALHVVELKTTEPVATLDGLAATFGEHVRRINALLEPLGARLLPTGSHPWMDPDTELRLWPHEYDVIYRTYDRIFDCRGHGWANLQSVHVNLPFAGDEEFGRLHAALRLVIPLVPALAASTPFADGRATGLMDSRLEAYRRHADRVPSVVGRVVPEPVFTRADYESKVLGTIYDAMRPLDPEGILRHEWVNARGCIARFDRMSIELRVVDSQESTVAEIAVVAALVDAVRGLTDGRWGDLDALRGWPEATLEAIMLECIRDGDRAVVLDEAFVRALGYPGAVPCRSGELWLFLLGEAGAAGRGGDELEAFRRVYARDGCLARRIATAVGDDVTRDRLRAVYGELARCLAEGRLFEGP